MRPADSCPALGGDVGRGLSPSRRYGPGSTPCLPPLPFREVSSSLPTRRSFEAAPRHAPYPGSNLTAPAQSFRTSGKQNGFRSATTCALLRGGPVWSRRPKDSCRPRGASLTNCSHNNRASCVRVHTIRPRCLSSWCLDHLDSIQIQTLGRAGTLRPLSSAAHPVSLMELT
jgi:hypothetical protein